MTQFVMNTAQTILDGRYVDARKIADARVGGGGGPLSVEHTAKQSCVRGVNGRGGSEETRVTAACSRAVGLAVAPVPSS